MGKSYPFSAASSSIELTVEGTRSRKEVTKKIIPVKVCIVLFHRNIIQIDSKIDVVLDGLNENEIYTVRRCILVDLSPSLINDPRFKFSSKKNKICVEEGYRTERTSSSMRFFSLLFFFLAIHLL